ncbi:MAG TPA: GTP 3',8-cyclase MoaA [Sediminibacterium sp.]|nr:GTP 3',8-cyclase MoaA [Sediminibacterium sp.]
MLKDRYDRVHNYLRISLTDHCNLRCFYCMPQEDYHFMPGEQLMQADEIISLAKIFVRLGVQKIRLTGGEPLVRKDAGQIIRQLGELGVELTITTNGIRVNKFVDTFRDAGIRSVNISLDTLQRERFLLLTRRDHFQEVYDHILLLLTKGFRVKVNAVIIKGVNDKELLDFVAWTKDLPLQVRFIEFMPFDGNRWNSDKLVTWQEMLTTIAAQYPVIPLENALHDTCKKYQVPGHAGSFAVISTMSAPFCSTCNRIRLTADGKIKNCLFSGEETDLLQALRRGDSVETLIRQSIHSKHQELGGQFSKDFSHLDADTIHNRSMIAIGG